MIYEILLSIVLGFPIVNDYRGHPIPRRYADVITMVALEHPDVDARLLARTLDVLAAHESGYNTHPKGHNDNGQSKGMFQTPTKETPDDVAGQARLAAKYVLKSWAACPEFPLAIYGSGRCAKVAIVERYQNEIKMIFPNSGVTP